MVLAETSAIFSAKCYLKMKVAGTIFQLKIKEELHILEEFSNLHALSVICTHFNQHSICISCKVSTEESRRFC